MRIKYLCISVVIFIVLCCLIRDATELLFQYVDFPKWLILLVAIVALVSTALLVKRIYHERFFFSSERTALVTLLIVGVGVFIFLFISNNLFEIEDFIHARYSDPHSAYGYLLFIELALSATLEMFILAIIIRKAEAFLFLRISKDGHKHNFYKMIKNHKIIVYNACDRRFNVKGIARNLFLIGRFIGRKYDNYCESRKRIILHINYLNRLAIENVRREIEYEKKISLFRNSPIMKRGNDLQSEKNRIEGILERAEYELENSVVKERVDEAIKAMKQNNLGEIFATSSSALPLWFNHEIITYFIAQMRAKLKYDVVVRRYYILDEKLFDAIKNMTALEFDALKAVSTIHDLGGMELWLVWLSEEDSEKILPRLSQSSKDYDKSFLLLYEKANRQTPFNVMSFRHILNGHGFVFVNMFDYHHYHKVYEFFNAPGQAISIENFYEFKKEVNGIINNTSKGSASYMYKLNSEELSKYV